MKQAFGSDMTVPGNSAARPMQLNVGKLTIEDSFRYALSANALICQPTMISKAPSIFITNLKGCAGKLTNVI